VNVPSTSIVKEDRVFPMSLGAFYLKKIKTMGYEKNIAETTSKK
jgi:hypothetical protein